MMSPERQLYFAMRSDRICSKASARELNVRGVVKRSRGSMLCESVSFHLTLNISNLAPMILPCSCRDTVTRLTVTSRLLLRFQQLHQTHRLALCHQYRFHNVAAEGSVGFIIEVIGGTENVQDSLLCSIRSFSPKHIDIVHLQKHEPI